MAHVRIRQSVTDLPGPICYPCLQAIQAFRSGFPQCAFKLLDNKASSKHSVTLRYARSEERKRLKLSRPKYLY